MHTITITFRQTDVGIEVIANWGFQNSDSTPKEQLYAMSARIKIDDVLQELPGKLLCADGAMTKEEADMKSRIALDIFRSSIDKDENRS